MKIRYCPVFIRIPAYAVWGKIFIWSTVPLNIYLGSVFHSRDLVNWEQIGHCITRPSQMTFPGTKASKGLYAPTIRYHAGTFYMVCTNTSIGEAGNFVVTSDNPRGPWSDPVWFSQTGIDPSLLFDDDGSVYLTSNGWGETTGRRGNVGYIQQSRVDIRTGAVTEGPE